MKMRTTTKMTFKTKVTTTTKNNIKDNNDNNDVNLQVLVSRHKEEVIINQLLADFLIHAGEGVVGTS